MRKKTVCLLDAIDGGPGSGNFGHKGRPGKRGGSGKGGGKAFRTGSAEKGFTGIQKAKAWTSISKAARGAKSWQKFVYHMDSWQKDAIKAQHKECGTAESLSKYTERMYNMLHTTPAPKRQKNLPVEGKDISTSWRWDGRTNGEIDTEIEAVIHAQGYDGVPKVVSRSDLEKQLLEHPEMPMLFRTYTAPNAEALEDFDEQLNAGSWYVDCGTGGAQYGQGMYCAGCYDYDQDTIKDKFEDAMGEMGDYISLGMERAISDYNRQPDPEPPEGYQAFKISRDSFSNEPHQTVYATFKPDEEKTFKDATPKPGEKFVMHYEGYYGIFEIGEDGWIHEEDGDVNIPMEWPFFDPESDTWYPMGPTIQKEPFQAQASIRMMTLDPSAKVISYKALANKADLLEQGGYSCNLADADFAQKYVEVVSGLRFSPESEVPDDVIENMAAAYYDTATRCPAGKYDAKSMDSAAFREAMDLADVYYRSGVLNESQYQEIMRDAQIYQRAFQAFKWRKTPPAVPHLPRDMGVIAAALGYDAINSEGHGRTGSYTVVLNRTKLIIAEERVDRRG